MDKPKGKKLGTAPKKPSGWTKPKLDIFKKEKTYYINLDLDKLTKQLEAYLVGDEWTVQAGKTDKGTLIQATKGGIIRQLIAADRGLTIAFTKIPNGFHVEIGIGKWLENLTTTVIETAVFGTIFLLVDIPELLWNTQIESKVLAKIDQFVEETTI